MSRRQRREQQLRLPLVLPRSSQTRPRLPDDSGSSIITSAVPDLRPPTASVVGASPTAPVVRPPPTAPASGRSLPLPPVPDDEPAPSELERSDAFSLILTLDDVAAGLARPRRARAHRPGPLAVGVLALAVVLWMTAYVQAWTALSMNDRCVNLWDRVVQAITAADFALR